MPRLVCDPFHFIRSCPRNLNLGCCKARMGTEASNSAACPGSLREHLSLICTICIKGSPRQFDALLIRLHQQSMLIFATIALGHQRLSSFNDCGDPRGAFFRVTLPRWKFLLELSLDCSKTIYFANVINGWSGIQRTELFPLLSAQCEGLRWSRLFDYTWFQHRGCFDNMTIYCLHQAFSNVNNLWRRHNIAENLNWNLSGFCWRTLYIEIKKDKMLFNLYHFFWITPFISNSVLHMHTTCYIIIHMNED